MIPKETEFAGRPSSERVVYERLAEALSDEWVVFYSLCYVRLDDEGERWDHEVDFLLYHERKGFLALEVKGGAISCRDGKWYQDGEAMDPIGQARWNKYFIMKMLSRKLNRALALRFAHAVCFPFSHHRGNIWPPEAEGLVITQEDLKGDIEGQVSRLIETAQIPKGINGTATREEILRILAPEFEFRPLLHDEIQLESEAFVRLTRRQCALLDALRSFPRLLVRGGAGTGKTMLAMHKAQSVADEGGQALFLCFNELLAKKIVRSIQKRGGGGYKVAAFFQFCVETMRIPEDEYERYSDNPALYSEVLPNLMRKWLKNHPMRLDAVVVDEAQDFTPQMWEVVRCLLDEHSHFYVFYDPDQNIFREQLSLPEFATPPVELTVNCRNTRRIFEMLEPYCTTGMRIGESSPDGPKVVVRTGDARRLLTEELSRIFGVLHAIQSDVVVLGGHSLDNTSLGADHQVGEYCLAETVGALGPRDVRYLTYMKFKGCESKFVILLDVDESDERWDRGGLYTAMSRAIHELVILRKGG